MASIKRRPDGVWRARYRDDQGKERSKHFARKVDAQAWLDEIRASQLTGTYVDPRSGRISLQTFYKQWSKRQLWVAGTRRAFDLALADSKLGDVELRALRHSHGEEWVRRQTERGLAPGTVIARMAHLRAVLAGAVRDRVIRVDPFSQVTLPRQRKAEASMRLPTTEEVAAMLTAASEPFAVAIALGAFAGLRAGEIGGLQVGDVDFLRRRIHVRRQVVPADGIRAPKYGSERVVYVPDALTKMISAHIARTRPDSWLFKSRTGEPADQNVLTQRFKYLRDKLELKHLRLHDLRHHYASGLIMSGCDVVTVSRALGHSSAAITLGVYAHLWPTAEDRTRSAAAGMMAALENPADSPRTSDGG